MPLSDIATETYVFRSEHNDPSTIVLVAAVVCLSWYMFIAAVCTVGYVQIRRYYSTPQYFISPTDALAGPHVTIIRPVKDLEPSLYDCLASTFRQSYPHHKLHVRFCISSRADPALPVLERLLRDFPDFDAQILIEEEDQMLVTGQLKLGPNPKIRNMSRAYREADRGKGGLVWIIDCNVWVGRHTCGRMIWKLGGNKFVHQLPLVVDTVGTTPGEETHGVLETKLDTRATTSTVGKPLNIYDRTWWNIGGSRLEELFMSTSHAKFYTAINTVLVAPCIVGKSTMFKLSHLDSLTNNQGIDFFSYNICEDHLIGDMLWKQKVPEEHRGAKLGKHALCFGDLAIQPMSNVSISEYWSRRVRWLRVRKFTVTLATLVEPGTESFLCSFYGAYAVTSLPFFNNSLRIPQTWTVFVTFWLFSVIIWCAMDWTLYQLLHSAASIHVGVQTPDFALPPKKGRRRVFREWILAWLGREALALPIWTWAFWGGTKVEWRGRKFWVGMDMKVHEIGRKIEEDWENSHANGGSAAGAGAEGKKKGRTD